MKFNDLIANHFYLVTDSEMTIAQNDGCNIWIMKINHKNPNFTIASDFFLVSGWKKDEEENYRYIESEFDTFVTILKHLGNEFTVKTYPEYYL
jgi:hypothetical protein